MTAGGRCTYARPRVARVEECEPTASARRLPESEKWAYDPTELSPARARRYQQTLCAGLAQAGLTESPTAPIGTVVVDVRWHVITRDDGSGGVSNTE